MTRERGFTLIEVLIAMAITAFVAVAAYRSLSAVMEGVDSVRQEAARLHEVTRTLDVLSRDIRQVARRSVIDEFGARLPALEGGPLARETLALTRGGWHNTVGAPRSALQRVAWYVEGERLIRAVYPVLDRTTAIEPREAVMLEGVSRFDVRFLADLGALQTGRSVDIDRRYWLENWVADASQPGILPDPPIALEVMLTVDNWGDLERLYVLPPL